MLVCSYATCWKKKDSTQIIYANKLFYWKRSCLHCLCSNQMQNHATKMVKWWAFFTIYKGSQARCDFHYTSVPLTTFAIKLSVNLSILTKNVQITLFYKLLVWVKVVSFEVTSCNFWMWHCTCWPLWQRSDKVNRQEIVTVATGSVSDDSVSFLKKESDIKRKCLCCWCRAEMLKLQSLSCTGLWDIDCKDSMQTIW